ncbi:MAG: HAD family hydrolase, partial [Hungatella sp.]
MIKLIASDLDGTLLRDGAQSLNPSIFTLIQRLKEKNILFVAASGRQYYNMQNLFAPVKDDVAYICENGSLGIFHDQLFSESYIDRPIGHEIIATIQEHPECELLLSCKNAHYISNPSPFYENHMRNVVKNKMITVPDIFDIKEPYLKISACNFSGISYLEPAFRAKFSDQVNIALAGDGWLDTIPKGTHKGYTLQKLLNQLGIHPDECIAFGDQYNDMEMLQLAGTSYAMSDAVLPLRNIASDTTDSVEDTIKKWLEL